MKRRKWIILAVIGVALLVVAGLHWDQRHVICSVEIPGHPGENVVFVHRYSIIDGDNRYEVELPNGAIVKRYLDPATVSPQQICSNVRVEYDGKTLKMIGPGTNKLLVPGYRIDKPAGKER